MKPARSERSPTEQAIIARDFPAFSASLALYAPRHRQAPHRHPRPVISLHLTGEARETAGGAEHLSATPAISIKPEGLRHGEEFGPEGAIFLSFAFHDEALWRMLARRAAWRWIPLDRAALGSVGAILQSSDPLDGNMDRLLDLLAVPRAPARAPGAPPRWLARAREALADDPGIPLAKLAAEAGVHRIHLTRAFARWFGVTPATFRRQRMTSLALHDALWLKSSPASAACGAGFSDQSHMARSIKRATGFSLGKLARMLAD